MAEEIDLNKLKMRIAGLREQNVRMTKQIQDIGANVDVGTARVVHFQDLLVDLGILTEEQVYKEHEQWELHLRGQLQMMLEQVQEMARAHGQPVKRSSGIYVPGKNGNG